MKVKIITRNGAITAEALIENKPVRENGNTGCVFVPKKYIGHAATVLIHKETGESNLGYIRKYPGAVVNRKTKNFRKMVDE